MKTLTLCLFILSFTGNSYAVNSLDFNQLLKQAQFGRAEDRSINNKRMLKFKQNKAEQKTLLSQARNELKSEEKRSKNLEQSFDKNDQALIKLAAELKQKQGRLKELLGGVQQLAGDTLGQLEESIISAQFPQRIATLQALNDKISDSSHSMSMAEIRQVWFEILREITESGKVAVFHTDVTNPAGVRRQQDVTRFGVFNITTTGDNAAYLSYNNGSLSELARQPSGSYINALEDFSAAPSDKAQAIALDPTRGQLLNALTKEPDLIERFHQGGLVGYLIAALGLVALLTSLFKIAVMSKIKSGFNKQLDNLDRISLDNPLGRVINVGRESSELDLESLELKFSEAIHRETPRLSKYHSLLKIIAVIAPLMGLLGTVVGMIITFQSITLYGTGDPKLMASGISSALVTTVLGLIVAIPTLFFHNYLSDQSKSMTQILEEQAIGFLAQQPGQK